MAKNKPINPAGRESDFFKMNDIKFEVKIARDYIKSDLPSTIFLYRIDIKKTKTNNIYGETRSKEKVTLKPIELNVKLNVEQSETVFLGDSGLSKEYAGDLTFTVFNEELEEKQVEISRGDFVGIIDTNDKKRFYEVIVNNKVNTSNKNSIAGIKSLYREIKCKPVDKDVFFAV